MRARRNCTAPVALGAVLLAQLASPRVLADPARPAPPPGRRILELAIESRTIPVVLHVPAEAAPEKGFPLIVSLHGQSVDGVRECDHNWRPQSGVVIACPTEPSTPWREPRGERIVLEVVRQLLARFALDPDRVFLGGSSSGGIGAWRTAVRRPDRFAGLIPRAGMPPMSTDSQLSNLLSMGLYVVHGAGDMTVRPEADRRACERLFDLGADVLYRELDGAHSAFPNESSAIAAWATKRRRDPAPRLIRYALGRNVAPLPERIHWLEFGGRTGLPIILEARADRAQGRIDVRFAEGYVENLRVLFDSRLVDTSRPVVVTVDGQERYRGIPDPDPALRDRLVESTSDPGVGFDRSIALTLPVPEAREQQPPRRHRATGRRHRRHRTGGRSRVR